MAYIVTLNNVTGPDVVSLTDGTTYATLTVNANAISPVVSDTTPQLGGDLDLNNNDITGTGNINITGTLDTSGNVTVGGNLTVNGTTTTINSTTLTVDDLNVVVASGAADAAAANGAGLTVDGANATLTYVSSGDKWALNKPLDVTGTVTATGFATTGNLTFGDNDKAIFGAGSDLQIYHDGTGSYIDELGTGDLYIRSNGSNLRLQNYGGENFLRAANNGTVELFYDNAQKFATTSTGVDVSGSITADGLTVDGTGVVNKVDTGTYSTTVPSADVIISRKNTSNVNGQTAGIRFDVTGWSGSTTGGAAIQAIQADGNVSSADLAFLTRNSGTYAERLRISNDGDISFYEDTGTTPKFFWDASAEKLEIGSIEGGADGLLAVKTNANNHAISIEEASGVEAYAIGVESDGSLGFYNSGSTTASVMFGDSGNVGIGTSSPSAKMHVNSGTTNEVARFESTDGTAYLSIMDSATSNSLQGIGSAGNDLTFYSNAAERMRIDSSGNVGIGTSSPTDTIHLASTAPAIRLEDTDSTGDIVGRVAQSGNAMYIDSDYNNSSGLGDIRIRTSGSERMRLDASGNLLVATTNSSLGAGGIQLNASGRIGAAASSLSPMVLNRQTSDGTIIDLRKDGTTVGSIGVDDNASDTNKTIYICSDNSISSLDVGFKFDWGANQITPCQSGGANRDNAVDLGSSTVRFDDIYATNGTIQTSDRNEKQDIAELDEAERRVAVAAKGLLRKFRWKSAVEEKGDDARIHFGIIAQDLQAAFEAEGLDAGRYAMFIHSTWTDEETGEEKSRMGIRYPELLAFIIGAM